MVRKLSVTYSLSVHPSTLKINMTQCNLVFWIGSWNGNKILVEKLTKSD